MTFQTFGSWFGVLQAIANGDARIFYHAPLDTAPRPVLIRRVYKNGKVRVDAGEVTFTADPGHLDRFRYLPR